MYFWLGMLMKLVFQKVWTTGMTKVKVTVPRLLVPSCNCKTARIAPPLVLLAVNEYWRAVGVVFVGERMP